MADTHRVAPRSILTLHAIVLLTHAVLVMTRLCGIATTCVRRLRSHSRRVLTLSLHQRSLCRRILRLSVLYTDALCVAASYRCGTCAYFLGALASIPSGYVPPSWMRTPC